MRYAAHTVVPSVRSRMELERVLQSRGASSFAFGWNENHDTLQFGWNGRTIRFTLPRVDAKDHRVSPGGRSRTPAQIQQAIEEADRQRWRALLLVVKAKLEAVEAGIAIFEQEFLAFIVTDGNLTVGEILIPRIQGGQPLLLRDGR